MKAGWGTSRKFFVAAILAATLGASLVIAAPSQATFPGTNGLIAYVGGGGLLSITLQRAQPRRTAQPIFFAAGNAFVINPSNPVPTQVTNTGNMSPGLQFNAQGTMLVGSMAGAGLVTMAPVAGAAITVVPNTTGGDSSPAFDPTGTKLTFSSFQISDTVPTQRRPSGTALGPVFIDSVSTIDLNGNNRTVINQDAEFPDWSPDGTFIAFNTSSGNAIKRMDPNGGTIVTLASTGPDGSPCGISGGCFDATVSPDNRFVAFAKIAGFVPCECGPPPPTRRHLKKALAADTVGGIAEVNTAGTTVTPRTITVATDAPDTSPSYSPDGTKIAFNRGFTGLSTAPSDGSSTVTNVGTVGFVFDTSWAPAAGVGTGTGTGTGAGTGVTFTAAGPSGKVKNGPCVFTVNASAPVTGSVAFMIGVTSGKNDPSPVGGMVSFANETSKTVSIDVKHSKHKHGDVTLTLSSPVGGGLGSPASATCDVKKK